MEETNVDFFVVEGIKSDVIKSPKCYRPKYWGRLLEQCYFSHQKIPKCKASEEADIKLSQPGQSQTFYLQMT